MRKLIGALYITGLCLVIGSGTVGCGGKATTKTTVGTSPATTPKAEETTSKKETPLPQEVKLSVDPGELDVLVDGKSGTAKVKIQADRTNYDGEIKLESKAAKVLTVKLENIAKGKNETEIEVIASDAAISKDPYTIEITGTGGKDTKVSGATLKVKVKKKE
jgi:hypothetical protein